MSYDGPRLRKLTDHLFGFDLLAMEIIDHPQEHIDALVEAGILEEATVNRSGRRPCQNWRRWAGFVTDRNYPKDVGDPCGNCGFAKAEHPGPGRVGYAVVQPHVHEWRVEVVGAKDPAAPGGDRVYLGCATCRAVSRLVPNRLPIEVPDD